MIATSTFTEEGVEADGRIVVSEIHTLTDGRVLPYRWLNDGTVDAVTVVAARAEIINKELAVREASRAMVTGTEIPYTKHQFLSRFTVEERKAIRKLAETNEDIRDFMEMLNASGGVYMTLARQGISYLQFLGILTAERAAIIGGD